MLLIRTLEEHCVYVAFVTVRYQMVFVPFYESCLFFFFVRSSQSPVSSNGAPSCHYQWISVEALLLTGMWVTVFVNVNYNRGFQFFSGMSSGAK